MRTAMPAGPPARRVDRFEWERALRDDPTLKERPHHVALVLATYANPDGTSVRPGIKTVAHDARMALSTARAHIKTLRDLGWLKRVRYGSSGGGVNDADEHHLTVPVGAAVSRPSAGRAPHVEPDGHRPDHAATAEIIAEPARRRPAAPARVAAPPAVRRSSTPTSAHQPAVPGPDHCSPASSAPADHRSPVSEPPPASERTTASWPAPTNQDQINTKAARVDNAPPPRCPTCSSQPPGSWGPPCYDCAELGRAHRARQTDLARAYARARRSCTECNVYGWLLGPDGELLDLRCDHPTVPPEVWTGAVDTAPPLPPPIEDPPAAAMPEQRGRHALAEDAPTIDHPPGWRPSPTPRHRAEDLTDA